ncbi:MAG: hypothetical protein IT457_20880 [Planctomycetes bacterium]|nr:hypothetical protein [Planctomycetota bacterium]
MRQTFPVLLLAGLLAAVPAACGAGSEPKSAAPEDPTLSPTHEPGGDAWLDEALRALADERAGAVFVFATEHVVPVPQRLALANGLAARRPPLESFWIEGDERLRLAVLTQGLRPFDATRDGLTRHVPKTPVPLGEAAPIPAQFAWSEGGGIRATSSEAGAMELVVVTATGTAIVRPDGSDDARVRALLAMAPAASAVQCLLRASTGLRHSDWFRLAR